MSLWITLVLLTSETINYESSLIHLKCKCRRYEHLFCTPFQIQHFQESLKKSNFLVQKLMMTNVSSRGVHNPGLSSRNENLK
ncbi:hypothetical protein HanRHA438_Chr09g0380681 [Helianthus annuus]|nr:hypothetical protein HanRHA438_Chr09g0380681 [Helianthus annuus]